MYGKYIYIITSLTNEYIDIYWANDQATYVRHPPGESHKGGGEV